ncbi:hypothetical protein [Ensifer adhaerens]|uniref:hypothetical protein n=1 Tax=Ensifer adhaerens TaxID=106592 RepID=UPI000CF1AA89|nr:hypothetical protein [Ensifer adhaerens]
MRVHWLLFRNVPVAASVLLLSLMVAKAEETPFPLFGTTTYAAGNQAVLAIPGKAWKIQTVNSLAMLHGARLRGGKTEAPVYAIAISQFDTSAIQIMVRRSAFESVSKDPAGELRKRPIAVTRQSASAVLLNVCLQNHGLREKDVTLHNFSQSIALKDMQQGGADLAVLWSPFAQLSQARPSRAMPFDCGASGMPRLASLIVAPADLLEEKDPERLDANRRDLAEVVASHLGQWQKARKDFRLEAGRLVRWYNDKGATVSLPDAIKELETRQPPGLEEQIAMLAGVDEQGLADQLDALLNFMEESGAVRPDERPDPASLMDRSILDLIRGDERLLAIARGEL